MIYKKLDKNISTLWQIFAGRVVALLFQHHTVLSISVNHCIVVAGNGEANNQTGGNHRNENSVWIPEEFWGTRFDFNSHLKISIFPFCHSPFAQTLFPTLIRSYGCHQPAYFPTSQHVQQTVFSLWVCLCWELGDAVKVILSIREINVSLSTECLLLNKFRSSAQTIRIVRRTPPSLSLPCTNIEHSNTHSILICSARFIYEMNASQSLIN